MIRFLTKQGATLDGMDIGNLTPLLCAVSNGQDQVINFLMDNGANIKVTDPSNKSVWHLALEKKPQQNFRVADSERCKRIAELDG